MRRLSLLDAFLPPSPPVLPTAHGHGSYRNKAVADGAVSFYLDHVVKARVSRHAYGIEISKAFDKSNEDHQRRKDGGMFTSSPSGHILLPKFFSVILASVRPIRFVYSCILLFLLRGLNVEY